MVRCRTIENTVGQSCERVNDILELIIDAAEGLL